MNQCPHCQKRIPSGTKTCPECGRPLPLLNRALDTYGGTIPDLFAFVHKPIQRLIPSKIGDILGSILGFAAVLVHVSLMIVFLLTLVVAANALLTGRLDSVDWFAEVASLIVTLGHLTLIYPAITRHIDEDE